jgi:hypothetical protein
MSLLRLEVQRASIAALAAKLGATFSRPSALCERQFMHNRNVAAITGAKPTPLGARMKTIPSEKY